MTPATPPSDEHGASSGQHLATISHDGRFWDVYLEFEDDPRHPEMHRGRLAYSAADRAEGEPVLRTVVVIIEDSYEGAIRTARRMQDHELVAFLRSLLP